MAKKNTDFLPDSKVMQLSPEELAKYMNEGIATADVVQLEPGQGIIGVLVGTGDLIERKPDPSGDEQDPLKTWRLRHDDDSSSDVLSSYQLEKHLPDLVGKKVLIAMMDKVQKGGRQINQYKIVDLSPKKAKK